MKKRLKLAGFILFIAVTLIVTVIAARWVISLRAPDKLTAFQAWVAGLGFGGALLLFGIQFVQIVVAFIPGGPIQIVTGALFGPLGGFLICLAGTFAATATVFWLVSRFGRRVIALFVDDRDLLQYKFLSSEEKLEELVLLLFFIPGTPKDALTYLFALTKIQMSRFVLLSTLARSPAIITSLLAGDSIVDGAWARALVMFILMTAVAAGGFFLHRALMKRVRERPHR